MNTKTNKNAKRAIHAKAEGAKAEKVSKLKAGKIGHAKADKAPKTPKAKKEGGESRSRIDVHTDAVRKAASAAAGTSVDALRDSLGICRKSVRKLLTAVGAVRGEDGAYHAK